MKTTLERFESKFLKTTGCWDWLAGLSRGGYGRFRLGTAKAPAHRVSYALYKGDIEAGLMVRHKCDNPKCVNPDHLILGTAADNAADMVERGRQAKGRGVFGSRRSYKGEGHPYAKLSQLQIDAIRSDQRLHRVIAGEYGVTRATISHAKRGFTWSHYPRLVTA